jgi:hypothetical protein
MLYAVCANGHLTAAGTPSTAKTFTADTSGTVSVACAPGQLLVGGGSQGDGGGSFAVSEAATDTISHWQVQVNFNVVWGGPVVPTLTETVYAVCMTVA